jgi:hypothetical protein
MKLIRNPLCIILLLLFSCDKNAVPPESSSLYFPAGRSFLGGSDIKVFINEMVYTPQTVFDSCGGYWFKIPETDLPASGKIRVEYTRRKGPVSLFKEERADKEKWLSPSGFIDVTNEAIKSKSLELTKNYDTNVVKAKQLQKFVAQYVHLNIYKDSFLEKASRTLDLGYGSCMNYSRLFVALCRASNIPARSVWGVIYGYNNDNIYDYHHQWAEVLDENGYWHQADFSYSSNFDVNDIRYLDLVYAPEENILIEKRVSDEFKIGTVQYFDNFPATLTGKLGFELEENKSPDYMKVSYTYKF